MAGTSTGRLPPAALALGGVFFLLGFVGASWVSRIPAVQADLDIGNGTLGSVLVGMPLGSVVASLALPSLVARFGSRRVVTATLPLSAAALLLPGLARGPLALALALVVLGAATGALDVAMNTHGVSVQRDLGRSVFARLHALWSLGGFVGAGAAALLAKAGLSPFRHFVLAAAAATVLGVPVTRALSEDPDDLAAEVGHRRWSRHRTVLVLATVCVAAFILEVVAADWGGVFLHRVVGASTTTAAAAFAAFAFPHFAVRAFGDPLVDRVAPRRLLVVALLVSGAGLLAVAAATTVPVVLLGLAVAGAGVGLVVPVGFAAAGRVPGVPPGSGVATAAGISYLAWTVSPAAVGGLSALTGLRLAILLAPATALVAVVVLSRSRTV